MSTDYQTEAAVVPLCQAEDGRADQLPETALRRILVDLGMRPDAGTGVAQGA